MHTLLRHNWGNNDGWLEMPVKDWYGMGVSGNRVFGLYLGDNQLSGSIPAEISQLSGLGDWALSGNQPSGSIPTELSQLSNLAALSRIQ